MSSYDTAINIINAASQELGLGVVSLSSASTGNVGYQLLGLLNALGSELLRIHDWQNLVSTETFSGDGVATTFDLPDDFGRQINQTQWDTSSRRPMAGPDSPQVWAWNQYGIVSVGIWYRYRIVGNQYNIYPTPANGEDFALYYISKNWVQDADDPADMKSTISKSGDIPQFDSRLLINGLKAKFWGQKGFDTTTLQREFTDMLIAEKGQSQGAPVINLSGNSGSYLLGWGNIPDGSWQV
jgi:hypothetical protein